MFRLLTLLLLLASSASAQNTLFAGNPGDMIYRGTTAWQRVPGGTAGQLLQSNGPTAAPTWTWGFGTYTTSPFVLPAIATNRALMNVTGGNAAPTAGTASQFLDTIGYDTLRPPATGSMLYKDGTTGTWQTTTGAPNVGYAMIMQSNGVPAWLPSGSPPYISPSALDCPLFGTGLLSPPAYRCIVGSDLPNPTATTLGAVFSLVASGNIPLNSIGTDGLPTRSAVTGSGGAVVLATNPSIGQPNIDAANLSTSLSFASVKLYDEAGALRSFYHPDGSTGFLQWNATTATIKSDTTTFSSSSGGTTFGTMNSSAFSYAGQIVGTSASASALAIGRLGSTTPALNVNASTAISITGINIVANSAGNGVAVAATGETNVQFNIDAAGSGKIVFNATGTGHIQSARDVDLTGNSTPTITFGTTGNVVAKLLATGTGGVVDLFNGGGRMAIFRGAASAINYFDFTAAATGGGVLMKAVGGDTDVAINISSFGAGAVSFLTNNGGNTQVQFQHTASANRFIILTGSNGGNPAISASAGSVTLNGFTFLSSVPSTTQGDILYSSATDTLTALAKNASATRYLSNTGTSNNPAWAQVSLSTGVTSTLPNANLDNMANSTIKCRTTAGTGVPEDCTQQQVNNILLQSFLFIPGTVTFTTGNTDFTYTLPAPPTGFTRYSIRAGFIEGASASLNPATFGVFTASGGGGTAVVASGTAVTVTATTDSTINNMQVFSSVNVNSQSNLYSALTSGQLFFRVQTASTVPATASVVIQIAWLP